MVDRFVYSQLQIFGSDKFSAEESGKCLDTEAWDNIKNNSLFFFSCGELAKTHM